MKTRHIIAIGLLSATAVGLLAIGIKTGKAKPKTQVKADYTQLKTITDSSLSYETETDFYSGNTNCFTLFGEYTESEGGITGGKLQQSLQISKIQNINVYDSYFFEAQEVGLLNRSVRQITTSLTYYRLTKETTTQCSFEISTSTIIQFTDNNTQSSIATTFTGTFTADATQIAPLIELTTITSNHNVNLYPSNDRTYINYYGTAQYNAGESAGYETGYHEGTTDGIESGYQTGYTAGYDAGETAGYQEGWNDNTSFNAPVDIRGLMLNILTMPFTFISQAFDVVLWEGTDYEFHLAGFIKGMIAIATILFIIRLFTSGLNIIGNYTSSAENRRLKRSQTQLNKAKTNLANRTNPNHKTQTHIHYNKD